MRTPSTTTSSASTSTREPSTATRPFTVTSPSAIRSSQRRRLPMPTRARTFWSRSGSAIVVDRRGLEAELLIRAQTELEGLDHVGPGHELAERWQLLDAVEAEPFEEHAGRAVE